VVVRPPRIGGGLALIPGHVPVWRAGSRQTIGTSREPLTRNVMPALCPEPPPHQPPGAGTSMLAPLLTTLRPATALARDSRDRAHLRRLRPHRRPHGVGHDPPVSRAASYQLRRGADRPGPRADAGRSVPRVPRGGLPGGATGVKGVCARSRGMEGRVIEVWRWVSGSSPLGDGSGGWEAPRACRRRVQPTAIGHRCER
jgi:hypothetical protein